MNIETLQNGELSIRYFRFGAPDGQPFIILPGIALKSVMESAEAIAEQYRDFSERYNVFVFDRRLSMPEHHSVGDMADDIITCMDSLSIKEADLFGVSQGGMIAEAIAVRRPDLVRRLVLCSTASYAGSSCRRIADEWLGYALSRNTAELMKSFAENIYTKAYCERYREAFAEFAKMVNEEDMQRFVIQTEALLDFDMREELGCISSPVLVIGAEQDIVFSKEAFLEIAEKTHGELYIYENGSHAVYDENPDVLVRIREFLDRE